MLSNELITAHRDVSFTVECGASLSKSVWSDCCFGVVSGPR